MSDSSLTAKSSPPQRIGSESHATSADAPSWLLVTLADQRWHRALHRALEREGAARRVGQERWQVRSHEREHWYEVTVRDDAVRCSCEAAQHGNPCWHAALAWYLATFPRSSTWRR